MKKHLLLLSALTAISAFASQPNDTITDVRQPQRVLVTQTDNAVSIDIHGSATDSTYRFNYQVPTKGTSLVIESGSKWDFSLTQLFKTQTKSKKPSRHFSNRKFLGGGLNIGFNHFVGAGREADNVAGSSFDADLTILGIKIENHLHSFMLTWSYGWSKYRLDGYNYFHFDGSRVSIGPYPEGVQPGRSVFRLNRHSINLFYRYEPKGSWSVTFGPTLNLHVRPRIYNQYWKDGMLQKEFHKHNIHYNPATVSLLGAVGYNDFHFYVKYNPASVFQKGFGPQFQTLTTGVSLFF